MNINCYINAKVYFKIAFVCVQGGGLAGKGYSSKLWYGTSEAQKSARRGCAGSLMAEMKHSLHCGHLGC